MIHDELVSFLSDASAPLGSRELAAKLGLGNDAESAAIVEILATLSPSVCASGQGWVAATDTPARRILSAIRSFADANPGKRIFRLSAAIGHLPPQDQPTDDQLRALLEKSDDFQLLPNAMIKRVT